MIKKILWSVFLGITFYYVLSHHFIVIGKSYRTIEKTELTLSYTIFNTLGKDNEEILCIDRLRNAGIGDLLVEYGRITEKEKDSIVEYYENDEEAP